MSNGPMREAGAGGDGQRGGSSMGSVSGAEADRIRTDDGYLTDLGVKLGQERMERFMQGQAQVQAMSLFLVMAVVSAPQAHYCDTALDVLITDAVDLRAAACDWAESCITLAEHWRTQRRMDEADRR